MSATGRGLSRVANDNYPTPDWLSAALCQEVLLPYFGQVKGLTSRARISILEPAAGEGKLVSVLRAHFPSARIKAADLMTTGQDFLQTKPRPIYDLVITNPPFLCAKEFVETGLLWLRPTPMNRSLVVMLLRNNFVGSQDERIGGVVVNLARCASHPDAHHSVLTKMVNRVLTIVSMHGSSGVGLLRQL